MIKKHLIITTAHFTEEESKNNGFPYLERIKEYTDSFNKVKNISSNFDSITLLETKSKDKLDYLEDSKFDICYSSKPNLFYNKGLNEIFHLENFLQNNNLIKNQDIIIKISGRYKIENINLLKYIDYDCSAKNDLDIYDSGMGVHTFYFLFKRYFFHDFYKYVNLDFNNFFYKQSTCIEWELKNFMLKNKKCYIIPYEEKIGVTTCIFSGKEWIKKYC